MGNKTAMGFRFTNRFRRATDQAEKRPNDKQPSMNSGWFKLDTRIASCYDTNVGVGIVERTDVNEKRAKGMSPIWIPVIIVAFLALLWFAPKLIRTGFFTAVDTMLEDKKEIVQSTIGSQVQVAPQKVPQSPPTAAPQLRPLAQSTEPLRERPAIKHIIIHGMDRSYTLSDGTVLRVPDPNILKAGKNHLIHKELGFIGK